MKELVDKNLYPLLKEKNNTQISTFLEIRLQHIFSMSVTRIIIEAYNIKFLDCNDIIVNIGYYKVAFDIIQSLITKGLWISKMSIEMALQKSLL